MATYLIVVGSPVAAGAPVVATPSTAALVLTSFAPTVSTPRVVTPPTRALVLSTFAPTVANPKTVTPGTLALIITTFAPNVTVPGTVTPGTVALVLTTFAPTVSGPQVVTPPTRALVIVAFAPTVIAPRIVTPLTTALILTGFAPTVVNPQGVTPGTLALILTGLAPNINIGIITTPGTRALILTTFAPTVIAPRIVTPPTLALILTGLVPIVTVPAAGGINILFQAALIAFLKADADLTAILPDGAEGIREEQWRGTAFRYPCIRVSRPTLQPYGNGACTPSDSRAAFSVTAFSKKDSTINAQQMQGVILASLDGFRVATNRFNTIPLRPVTLSEVVPQGEVWQGPVSFRTIIHQRV